MNMSVFVVGSFWRGFMIQRAFIVSISLIVMAIGLASAVSAGERVALVIGNSEYKQVSVLPNPRNDAADIAASLKRLEFNVQVSLDLTYGEMRRALRDFGNQAIGADVALVYFAGHGIEVSRQNYLVPVDAQLKTDLDVDYEAIPLDMVMGAVQQAKGLRIVLLDACRNNPFVNKIKSTSGKRSIGRGLAGVEPTVGTLLSYAAKEGTTADDGNGRNSPYTKALLDHLEEPGLEVNFLFRKVRDKVIKETGGRQEPFTYGSLPGKRIFLKAPEAKPQVVEPKTDQTAIELAYWNAIKDSDNPAVVRSYLEKFPKGAFNFLARNRLMQIEAAAAAKRAKASSARKAEEQAAAEAKRVKKQAKAAQAEKRRKAEAKSKAEAAARVRREKELADWRAVRGSTDPAALQAYLIKYPAGAFSDLAQARLEAAKQLQMAALQPKSAEPSSETAAPAKAAEEPTDNRQLVLRVQQELARLGCSPGRPDGAWGAKSKRALESFARHGKLQLASLDPSTELLETLSKRSSRVCPLVCSPRQKVKGNRCMLKTCPRGQDLTRSGTCIAKKKKAPTASKTKKAAVKTPKAKIPQATKKQCGRCNPWGTADSHSLSQVWCGLRYQRGKASGQCK